MSMKSSEIDSCQILIKRILIDAPTAQNYGNQNTDDTENTFKAVKFVKRHSFSSFETRLNNKYKNRTRLFNLDKNQRHRCLIKRTIYMYVERKNLGRYSA